MIKSLLSLFIIYLLQCPAIMGQSHKYAVSAGGIVITHDFCWSIAGNSQGQSPNILSELQYNNIVSMGYFLSGAYTVNRFIEFKAYYQRNGVIGGVGVDTDYGDNDRQNATFERSFTSDRGHLEVFKTGIKTTIINKEKVQLKLRAAFKNTKQNFVMRSKELDDLNSTYLAKWTGAELAIDCGYKVNESLGVISELSYALLSYRAAANWNLVNNFMHPLSFAQRAAGRGIAFSLGLHHKANDFLSFVMEGMLGNTTSTKGRDISYLQNGGQLETQFNGSKDKFAGIRIGARASF